MKQRLIIKCRMPLLRMFFFLTDFKVDLRTSLLRKNPEWCKDLLLQTQLSVCNTRKWNFSAADFLLPKIHPFWHWAISRYEFHSEEFFFYSRPKLCTITLSPTFWNRLNVACGSKLGLKHTQSGRGARNAKKPLHCFPWYHENALNESCKMSPHLIGLGWHPRSLLWPASGSGLDMIWFERWNVSWDISSGGSF